MAVPVVLGASTFDYTGLRKEQARLSKMLLLPSPRDIDDTSQVFEVADSNSPPTKYSTFIKVAYDKEGSVPKFTLFMKDNIDTEFDLSTAGPVVVAGGFSVNSNYQISPITGEVRQGGVLLANGTFDPATPGTLKGTVKFDGVSGLSLATINERIADVSNAIEGLTKILSVVSSNIDAVINTIR